MRNGIRTHRGFTLIELMITVVIIGILSAIAVPSYQKYVRQSRRVDAQNTMLGLQQQQEKWRINNTTYGTITNLGGSPASSYYDFSVTGTVSSTTYAISAVAKTTASQNSDTGCTTMTIDQSGTKTPTACWKQ